jgi:glycosyltransferase involved in cell wall biosynthesis
MKVQFSVLITAYNRADLTREAIDSVLAQTFTDYEVIVVDDGSTDHMPQVLASYGTRIKAVRQRNQGVEAALKHAASLAQGQYLCPLDNDDLFFPHTLATYDQIVRAFDSPPMILGSITWFNHGEPIKEEAKKNCPVKVRKYADYLSKREPISNTLSRIVIHRSLYDEVEGFGNKGGGPTDCYPDYDLMMRTGTHGPCIIVHEPCTMARRIHATAFTQAYGLVYKGICGMADSERKGLYPRGKHRRAQVYAVIGGFALQWIVKRFLWKTPKLAFLTMWKTGPMMVVATWRRFMRIFHKQDQLIVLPE